MKLAYKIPLGLVVLLIIALTAGYIYLMAAFPIVKPAPNITIQSTPEMIKRGEYLANHLSVCMDCHSRRDWSLLSGPPVPNTLGMGGERFDEDNAGIPGTVIAKNITPAMLSNWTDGELYRMITTGMNKKNEQIFMLMPYASYSKMDPEDVKSIIAYIRTIPAINNSTEESKLNFPVNLIMRTIHVDAQPMPRPAETDTVNYGKYCVTISGCRDCHTPADKGQPLPGMEFAGGFEFRDNRFGVVRSANITPDMETGIGKWTEDQFVLKFKFFDIPENKRIPVKKGEFQTAMPWTMFAGMKESDLRAIYRYLRTLKPNKHNVVKFTSVNDPGFK